VRPIETKNSKKRRNYLHFFIPTLIIAMISCNKAEEETKSGIPKGIECGVEMPQLRSNTLAFNSNQHLLDYYQWIQSSISNRDTVLYPTADSLLSVIETSLNFRSVRKSLQQKQNERDLEQEDWLRDDIRKAILNEDYEIVIDGYKYVYYSENQIYKFPESDYIQEQLLKSINKGDDENIPKEHLKEGTELISKNKIWTR